MILNLVEPYLTQKKTNLNQHQISFKIIIQSSLYRLGHGAFFTTLSQLFGVSISLASVTNKVCGVLVATLYDRYAKLPQTDEEWETELKGSLENYEFPCVGAWAGFYVYVSSKLKSYFSFKKRDSMSNLRLVSYNKKFLYCAVRARESTHDTRMLRNSAIYQKNVTGHTIPDRVIDLGEHGKMLLVNVGDTGFPKHA